MAENDASTSGRKWIGILFIVIGIGALIACYFLGRKQLAILKSWPEITAQVLNSEVTFHEDPDDSTTTYGARIEFAFFLEGRGVTAVATRGYTTSVRSSMERTVAKYAPGTQHTIRYNPDNATDVRFNATYSLEFFGVPAFAAVFGLIFLSVGVALTRKQVFPYASTGTSGACPTCGAPVPVEEKFCPKCGTMLHQA